MYVTANDNKWAYLDNIFPLGKIFQSNEYGPITKKYLIDNNISSFSTFCLNSGRSITKTITQYTYFDNGEIKINTNYSIFPVDTMIDGGPAPNTHFQFIKNQGGRKRYDFFKSDI